ncbi:MAG: SRPBCC domain-containing protein [Proteobacteria bacterium]|nr:SRPBCC domain-containing protein [Pseudomonadota bacterium]
MKFENEFTVDAPQQAVWNFITTPAKVGPCIPGCEDVDVVGPGKYRAAIKLQAGPIKTTFHVTVTTTEERPPEFSTYVTQGDEGGRASRLNATSSLSIAALEENRTTVSYSSDIKIAGRLGKFSIGVMHKMAEKMNDKFIAALRAGIASELN